MSDNKKAYSTEKVIQYYDRYEILQKPEQVILDILKNRLKDAKMLDIGVGGGRTTLHFAPLVKEYIGIDTSKGMIDTCKNKFETKFPHAKFMTSDVCDMNALSSNDFDFVLFSFNGIDMLSDEERVVAFRRIREVLKNDGCFCFSSHNIQYLEVFFKIHLRLNMLAVLKKIFSDIKIRKINQIQFSKARTEDFVIINDGAHQFMLDTYYVRPSSQIKTLAASGFNNIRTFSLNTGQEFKSSEELNNSKDKWIYYLCNG